MTPIEEIPIKKESLRGQFQCCCFVCVWVPRILAALGFAGIAFIVWVGNR